MRPHPVITAHPRHCSTPLVERLEIVGHHPDRSERKATLSLKVEGGEDHWISGNWLTNGVEPRELERDNRL
jgi:hypothetical protein